LFFSETNVQPVHNIGQIHQLLHMKRVKNEVQRSREGKTAVFYNVCDFLLEKLRMQCDITKNHTSVPRPCASQRATWKL